MAQRYECKLSPELLKKAVDELNEPEDNDVRLAAIDKLRTRFQEEQKDLELIRSDDAFLLRFLRVRKFDQDRAYETLKNYHLKRKEHREIFDFVDDPKLLSDFLTSGPVIPLREGKAKDGSFVFVIRPGRGFTKGSDAAKMMAVGILTIEKLLEEEEFQIRGLTIINDVVELGLTYGIQMASYGGTFFTIIQEALPLRVKSINLVNEALIFDALYAVISRFLKEKMKKRLQLHGTVFTKLHEKIDPSYLPFFLGGSGPDLNADWWAKEILSSVGEGEETEM